VIEIPSAKNAVRISERFLDAVDASGGTVRYDLSETRSCRWLDREVARRTLSERSASMKSGSEP